MREKLLHTSDLNLQKCIEICRISEIHAQDVKIENSDVKTIAKQKGQYKNPQGAGNGYQQRRSQSDRGRPGAYGGSKPENKCKCCGKSHEKFKCPAYYSTCGNFGWKGHFTDLCLSKPKSFDSKRSKHKSTNLHEIDEDEDEYDELFFLGSIEIERELTSITNDPWMETINGIAFKLDTGSQVNTLPKHQMPRGSTMSPTSVVLRVYGGKRIVPLGKIDWTIKGHTFTFQIVDVGEAILGKNACQALGLIKRTEMKDVKSMKPQEIVPKPVTMTELAQAYPDVFKGLGCIGTDYALIVDNTVQPTVDPPRKIPFRIKLSKNLSAWRN